MAGEGPFTFGATVSLACTTSTGSVAVSLPAGQQLVITSLGPDITYIAVGTSVVAATTSSFPVLPGTQFAISLPYTTSYIAAICPTSTSTLKLSSADGYVSGVGASSVGAGGGGDPVAVTSVIPGTGATNLGKAEDAPSANGDTGVGALFVRTPASPTAQTSTDGDYGFPALDQFGDVKSLITDSTGTPITYLAPGQAVMANSVPVVLASDYFPAGFTYTNISTSTTTQVKSGAGVLHAVVVNTLGTVASTVSVYDSTSTTSPTVCIINSLTLSGTFTFDAAVTTGIRVVTTGTAAPNVTILWR